MPSPVAPVEIPLGTEARMLVAYLHCLNEFYANHILYFHQVILYDT